MRASRRIGIALLGIVTLALVGCSGEGTHTAASPPGSGSAASSSAARASASPGDARTSPAAAPPGTAAPSGTGAPSESAPLWAGYHDDAARTGSVPGAVADPARARWTAQLGAAVYGQPVVSGNTVLVGTESDDVVALDRATGRRLWTYRLGTPLTDVTQRAGCGDVDPLGITSTLAIDPRRGEVFAVGEVVGGDGAVHHRLVGLSIARGAVELSENVDPPLTGGQSAVHLLQRASLAIGSGRVYVGYGGNDGDCGSYHGWLVGAPESGPGTLVSFEVAPDGQGGAIWLSGGAPAVGSDGSVYVTTGNANPFPPGTDRLQYTESVVKLSETLAVRAAYKDSAAGGDEDLATGNPVLLPGGLVFAVGKTDVGYLLRASDLTRVAAISGVCGSDPDGGPAYDPGTQRLFVPCRDGGVQVIDVAQRRLGPKLPGPNGAPIVVGGKVWAAIYPDGGLTEFGAGGAGGAGGALVQTVPTPKLPSFASPSYAGGWLFLGTRTGVSAFG